MVFQVRRLDAWSASADCSTPVSPMLGTPVKACHKEFFDPWIIVLERNKTAQRPNRAVWLYEPFPTLPTFGFAADACGKRHRTRTRTVVDGRSRLLMPCLFGFCVAWRDGSLSFLGMLNRLAQCCPLCLRPCRRTLRL